MVHYVGRIYRCIELGFIAIGLMGNGFSYFESPSFYIADRVDLDEDFGRGQMWKSDPLETSNKMVSFSRSIDFC